MKVPPPPAGPSAAELGSHSENLKAFVEDTAAKTGKGRSTIAREAKRGADIRDVAQLAGTSLNSGVELDAMARLPEGPESRRCQDGSKASRGGRSGL